METGGGGRPPRVAGCQAGLLPSPPRQPPGAPPLRHISRSSSKSRLCGLLARVCFNASPVTAHPTEAQLYRSAARTGGAQLLDEVETLRGDRARLAALISGLNVGVELGGVVTRLEKRGERFVEEPDEVHAPAGPGRHHGPRGHARGPGAAPLHAPPAPLGRPSRGLVVPPRARPRPSATPLGIPRRHLWNGGRRRWCEQQPIMRLRAPQN